MNTVTNPVQKILSRLQGVKRAGNQWQAKCPAHEDSKASLSLKRGDDGRVLIHCFAGCSTKDICSALDIAPAELFVSGNGNGHQDKSEILATYDYRDEAGQLLYQA